MVLQKTAALDNIPWSTTSRIVYVSNKTTENHCLCSIASVLSLSIWKPLEITVCFLCPEVLTHMACPFLLIVTHASCWRMMAQRSWKLILCMTHHGQFTPMLPIFSCWEWDHFYLVCHRMTCTLVPIDGEDKTCAAFRTAVFKRKLVSPWAASHGCLADDITSNNLQRTISF